MFVLCCLGTNGFGYVIDLSRCLVGNRVQPSVRIFEVSHLGAVSACDISSFVIIKSGQCHGLCGTDIRLIHSVAGFTALCCKNRHRDGDEYSDDGNHNQEFCEREAFLSVHITIPFIGHAA